MDEKQPQTIGKNYLLAIGINEYTDPNISKLKNAVNDTQSIAQVLVEKYGFENRPEFLLFNEHATKDAIIEKLNDLVELFNKNPDQDNLLLYFAGHGNYYDDYKEGYRIPVDGVKNKLGSFIQDDFILNRLKFAIRAKHILFISDSCFSGSLFRSDETFELEKFQDGMPSRHIFASSLMHTAADGERSDNSPFAKALLVHLKNNTMPLLAFPEIAPKIIKSVLSEVGKNGQKPHFDSFHQNKELYAGQFILRAQIVDVEKQAYEFAKANPTVIVLDDFLDDYPNSKYYSEIKTLLKQTYAWGKTVKANDIPAYRDFIDDYPESPFLEQAKAYIKKIKERAKQITETPKPVKIETPNIIIPTTPQRLDFEPEMVFVKGGTFAMGSNEYDSEKPIHNVTLDDFYIGKFTVTQAQWQAVMGKNPSHFKGENFPVEQVSWDSVQKFIEALNKKTGKQYILPTEAQWEFAARGGRESQGFIYSGSNNIEDVAWYDENHKHTTHEVGTTLIKGNELGICDMSGNVWEWCADDWHNDYKNASINGDAWIDSPRGSARVVRGGSWHSGAHNCRATYRHNSTPTSVHHNVSFRLALSLPLDVDSLVKYM